MLTLRQKIFIFSGVGVALVLVIVFALLYLKNQNNKPANQVTTTTNSNVIDSSNPNVVLNNINQKISKPTESPEELYVKQLAIFFVERFFTYSNQNNNIHIKELQDSVTDNMSSWMNTQAQKAGVNYSGVTTNVLSSKITSFDKANAQASVEVEAKQVLSKEVNNNVEQSTNQKTWRVDLKLVDNSWKVDGVWDVNS